MSDNRLAFQPLFGRSPIVQAQENRGAGKLFFETDTGKIYLDIDANNRITMGGTSMFYTTQGGENDEIGKVGDDYMLRASALDLPADAELGVGDLIVGADGSFYRIKEARGTALFYKCSRMTIGSTGGGAAVFYSLQGEADSPIPVDDDNEGYFLLDASEVEVGESKIKIDDLIIGADNAFYRVAEILEDGVLSCTRLAISGGGGGGTSYSDKAKLFKEDPESNYLINGKEASIRIYALSGRDPVDGEWLDTRLTVYWTLSERPLDGSAVTQYAQGNFPITATTDELNPIWESFEYGTKARYSAQNILKMYVRGSSSTQSREFTYEFFTSDLQLQRHPNFSNINTYPPNGVTIYCTTVGGMDKIIYYYFETNGVETCLNPRGTVIGPGTSEQSITVPVSLATHGAHNVRIELYQYINGKADLTSSATPIEMEIGVVDPESSQAVIWLGDYQSEYYQYDSIRIPFRVFDPSAQTSTKVTLFKDSNKIGERNITDSSNFSIWEIVDADLGASNYYAITCGEEENEARREITFRVSEDPTRVDMKITTAGLRYLFDASGRSNSESATNRIKSVYVDEATNTSITASFENFNWYNNGWVTDSSGNTCLRISNGARFSIPLKATQFATSTNGRISHTFEFQFKVRNVQDYSNIVHNITRYKGNTDERYPTYPNWTDEEVYQTYTSKSYLNEAWSNGKEYDNYDAFLQWYLPAHFENNPGSTWPPSYDDIEYRRTDKILNTAYAAGKYYDGQRGICIGAQDALFTNGVDTVNVSYVEDKVVNLTIVYSHGDGTPSGNNMLMSIYLNGMLTGVSRSTLNEAWSIGADDTINLVFDSQYCDFDLYKIRVYNQPLTLPAILVNYTVDLKDPVAYDLTKLAVVNNSIGESQLQFDEMLTYNANHPDGYIMPYLVLTTKEASGNVLPFSKSVKIPDVQMEFVNTGLERAYTTGELGELAERAGQTVEEYYKHHCPSWKGDNITLQVQGTSSEFYPRRNYKAKTKDGSGNINMYMNRGPFSQLYADPETLEDTHLKFFYYDNDTVGTTKFTLKIDYMESSGTYNMGFANMVKNAYTHHPLWDYNRLGAFVVEDTENTDYVDATGTTFDPSVTYWYRNHNGNWKPADGVSDNLSLTSAEEFAMTPYDLYVVQYPDAAKIKAAKEGDEGYGKWYVIQFAYKTASVENVEDYRTSVQGFPVLTFHQTTDANGNVTSIRYIGRYNMLLDKGSDEAYGFKPITKVYSKWLKDDAGHPKAIGDIAECWEAENNSRGFCSFRDAATNRVDDKFFDTGKLTTAGAPIVADYWEYRYHPKADSLDVIYDLNTKIADSKSATTVMNELGVDITDVTAATCPDPSYTGDYTAGMKAAGDAMLDVYSNWERAVRWVYSTDQEAVPSAGQYVAVDLGLEVYAANTYFILDDNSEFVLDNSVDYDSTKTYYKLVDEEYEPIKLCDSIGHLYEPNTYYIASTLNDNEYVLDPEDEFNVEYTYYELDADEAHSGAAQLPEAVTYSGHEYHYDTKEYRNAKFVNELAKHFNLEYLVTYFVLTEVFECYDSRGKNAMFASWGPQEENGDYIWYPLFYDIDTQLGINNTGIPSFEYYVDATENGTFSTNDSLLWNNLYKNFRSLIIQKYRQLRGKSSTYDILPHAPLQTIDRIEKWYLADPAVSNSMAMRGERPLIAFNLDEYFKYISITNEHIGYQNREGGISYDNGTYFYALQGDRSLSRQQFLTNRFNYIDSWLNQGNYERGGTNIIRGRIAANSRSNTSDWWIEGTNVNSETNLITNSPYWTNGEKTHMFDGEYWITMEPVRNSYVTVGTDTANFPSLKYTNLEGPVRFETPDLENGVRTSGGYHEQLYYIYGLDQMKSLGDMSRLYWTEFNIEGSATKMTDLLLGYDGLDEEGRDYLNSGVNLFGIHASNSVVDNGGMPLLKRVNMSNLVFNEAAPTYNFASCEKLEDFRAIGSNITNVTFADGVALHTLYLPRTIAMLNLTEATKLNNIVTHFIQRDETNSIDVTPGLYIPGLTDIEDTPTPTSSIAQISLIGDCLGYDSYKLLSRYFTARLGESLSKITVTDVKWSPYTPIDEGTEYVAADNTNHLYWEDDGHYGFKEYQHVSYDNWVLKIKNGELYKYNPALAENAAIITSTELLDNLRTNSNFISTAETNNAVPIITGLMYVDNDTSINEATIANNIAQYYPNLQIFFKTVEKIPAAKYVVLNDDGTYDLLARKSLTGTRFPSPRDVNSGIISSADLDRYDTRTAYDFYGWSNLPLNPSAVEALAENDDEWYASETGNLIVTTNNSNSAALSSDQWYDNWNEWNDENVVEGTYDYVFYAVFGIHKYKMTYYDGDGSVLETVLVPAGQSIASNTPKTMPYKEMVETEPDDFYKLYKFVGWALTDTAEQPTEWTDENLGRAARDRRFYPIFEKDSVRNNILPAEYLIADPATTYQGVNGDEYGVLIGLRPGYTVRGKITLPKTYQGQRVLGIRANGFAVGPLNAGNNQYNILTGSENVTMVFWEDNGDGDCATPRILAGGAFANWDDDANRLVTRALRYYEFTESLEQISANAFYRIGIPGKGGGLIVRNIAEKAPNLYMIGNVAFFRAFQYVANQDTITLPGAVYNIGRNVFAWNHGAEYGINCIELGTANALSQFTNGEGFFGENALWAQGSNGNYSLIIHTNNNDHSIWNRAAVVLVGPNGNVEDADITFQNP